MTVLLHDFYINRIVAEDQISQFETEIKILFPGLRQTVYFKLFCNSAEFIDQWLYADGCNIDFTIDLIGIKT